MQKTKTPCSSPAVTADGGDGIQEAMALRSNEVWKTARLGTPPLRHSQYDQLVRWHGLPRRKQRLQHPHVPLPWRHAVSGHGRCRRLRPLMADERAVRPAYTGSMA